ncbi:MAG: rRNA maturation RNase YbeY [Rickettsiaceae bacterium H1]|nr:rRNA maturation RNase YbeY [Rickettsiaceae bacterium H1]
MIDINIRKKKWHSCCKSIKSFIKKITFAIPEAKNKKISVLLTDDDQIQELNKKFRNENKPTNVLSFPYENFPDGTLGDVILSFETIEKEAKEEQISFKKHMAHMLIHGVLHLLGYTHDHDEDAEVMEKLENKILSEIDL